MYINGTVPCLLYPVTSARALLRIYLITMAFTIFFCLSLLAAFRASAQSTCTTLQPVFELPLDATSTVYSSTITSTSSLDCGGCSLVVSTFRAIVETPVSDLCVSIPPCNELTTRLVGTNANDDHD